MLQALLSGLIPGSVYALLAVSLVLGYRMTGVLNFAQTAVGATGAYTFMFAAEAGVALSLAVLAGLSVSIGLSLALGWMMISFFAEERAEVRATVTIATALGLLALGFRVFGDRPRPMPDILPDWSINIGPLLLSSGIILALFAAVLTAIALSLLLTQTRLGLQMRAMSTHPTTAKIVRVPADRLSYIVWAIIGAIAMIAIVLAAPTRVSSFLSLTLLLIPALAAALFGLYRSFGLALLGGLLIGLLEGAATLSSATAPFRYTLPFLAIALVLGWTQRKERWDAAR